MNGSQHARLPKLRFLVAIMLAAFVVWLSTASSQAQDPPPFPNFTTLFGEVQLNDTNITPSNQSIIAFMNGHSCGWNKTQIAEDHPDIGKTVYVLDARAAGTSTYRLPNCGSQSESITFYFPEIGWMATESTTFAAASFVRIDLSLGVELRHRLRTPLAASDGIN